MKKTILTILAIASFSLPLSAKADTYMAIKETVAVRVSITGTTSPGIAEFGWSDLFKLAKDLLGEHLLSGSSGCGGAGSNGGNAGGSGNTGGNSGNGGSNGAANGGSNNNNGSGSGNTNNSGNSGNVNVNVDVNVGGGGGTCTG